ncbi:energy transducer TonB [Rhodanobacter sp. AS-Z3]|uniref:energy transducer TonB n=1 Tax=Rhodanobacter sp. AS-Z3 TaxID=3031330 RepID=UPI002478E59F|nr:energy transducer TonB [Rhodanobacter sp. AS-Z3]WEN15020.1 energy transducer TonB [Rhodanobacter sp. AS-Z3]
MSSASLAVFHRIHPDPARIAAISAAIVLNVAVIMVASRPSAPAFFHALEKLNPIPTITFITPPPPVKPPPPVDLVPLPHPPVAPPVVHHLTAPVHPPVVVPSTDGNLAMPPISTPTLLPAGTAAGPALDATPIEASLAYRSAPLRFPTRALQQRMQGTVLLRVLVDATGKPVKVTVEHGSGYALLDRSAVEQVLAGWRFQPATVNGQSVSAWARVPVSFNLNE